jgi:hypothetical protein
MIIHGIPDCMYTVPKGLEIIFRLAVDYWIFVKITKCKVFPLKFQWA